MKTMTMAGAAIGPDHGEQHEYETHQARARMQHDGLAKLREPFPENQISYLPKGGVKLAYVGHAALTDRLLDADPFWSWEPLAMSEHGLPVMDDMGGMWIKLTVQGVTRIGYGHAGTKTGGDAIKEVIGDALRNAAMRFGAALDLWHKGDLHAHLEGGDEAPPRAQPTKPAPMAQTAIADWLAAIEAASEEELRGIMEGAYKAAEALKDRDAYQAFRAAKNKRPKVAA